MVIMSFIFISLDLSWGFPSAVSNIVWFPVPLRCVCDVVEVVAECVKLFDPVPFTARTHKSISSCDIVLMRACLLNNKKSEVRIVLTS